MKFKEGDILIFKGPNTGEVKLHFGTDSTVTLPISPVITLPKKLIFQYYSHDDTYLFIKGVICSLPTEWFELAYKQQFKKKLNRILK